MSHHWQSKSKCSRHCVLCKSPDGCVEWQHQCSQTQQNISGSRQRGCARGPASGGAGTEEPAWHQHSNTISPLKQETSSSSFLCIQTSPHGEVSDNCLGRKKSCLENIHGHSHHLKIKKKKNEMKWLTVGKKRLKFALDAWSQSFRNKVKMLTRTRNVIQADEQR